MVKVIAITLLGLGLSEAASGTTYTYVGPNYNSFAGSPYTTAMSVTGTFNTTTPLPANMPSTHIALDGSDFATPLVTTWSFSDGVNTLTQANSSPYSFVVATDNKGNIASFAISLQSPQPPHTIGELINNINIDLPAVFGTLVFNAATCTAFFLGTNVCSSLGPTTQTARSTGSGAFTPNFAAVPPTVINGLQRRLSR